VTFHLTAGERFNQTEAALISTAEHFVTSHGLMWEGTKSVNKSDMPYAEWEVWSQYERQLVEIAPDGRVMGYIDFRPPGEGSPPLSRGELLQVCRVSGLVPEDAEVETVSYANGKNYVTFHQNVLNRTVRFNAIKIGVTGTDNIAGVGIRWTEFDPKAFDVELSEQEAVNVCREYFENEDGDITGTELMYVKSNEFFGGADDQSIHLAYNVRYVRNPKEPEYFAELWIGASTGEIVGGDFVP
jgi:hypothetical protein